MTVRKNTDYGKEPYVVDIEKRTLSNENFRTTCGPARICSSP